MKVKTCANSYWSITSEFTLFDKEKEIGYKFIPSNGNILFIEKLDENLNRTARTSVNFEDLANFF